MSEAMQTALAVALTKSDNTTINKILDSALADRTFNGAVAENQMLKQAVNEIATKQLIEAIVSEDPRQLKGALVAAKRLNAIDLPEFHAAITKYKNIKRIPAGWDVKNMVLQRQGDKMVAKDANTGPEFLALFQRLLDLTHRKVYTRDRMGDAVPERLEVVSVATVSNEDLWADYACRREFIRRELQNDSSGFGSYGVDTQAVSDSEPSAVAITANLALDFAEPLMSEVNEVFLFHGTSEASADAITTGNFRINLAGSHTGTLYGRGVYLAENGTKSDEYTHPASNGLRYLLLCRVLLGRVLYSDTRETNPRDCEEACLKGKYHSVLGDRKKCRGTFREFVVFDEEQVYANYIIAYRRIV
jgi:hypothetical protein